ncbi:MAG: hypothetical protein M1337_05080 [Actinobacteria bacterium]|nr:hypothetical protein [Actinomycetota bacterium]
MPWFPGFAYVLDLATCRTGPSDDSAVTAYTARPTSYEPGLVLGAAERVTLNDPQVGRIVGLDALAEFGRTSARWLAERNARTELVASTVTPERAVGEFVVHLTEGGTELALPVAVAVERRSVADQPDAIDFRVRCALEYNALRWGAHDMPPQAGIAVYERGPSGRLIAARVYDDVEPPELVAPGPQQQSREPVGV